VAPTLPGGNDGRFGTHSNPFFYPPRPPRSAYKLLQIGETHNIFAAGARGAIDLCAAPGSWSQAGDKQRTPSLLTSLVSPFCLPSSRPITPRPAPPQVLSRRLWAPAVAAGLHPPPLVAVDLQPMAPVEGVTCLQGDITAPETVDAVLALLAAGAPPRPPLVPGTTTSAPADAADGATFPYRCGLVVNDGAPDVTGLHDLDSAQQDWLLSASLRVCEGCLDEGGTLVVKIFRPPGDGGYNALRARLRSVFARVELVKPASSRCASVEGFAVARGYRRPGAGGGGAGGGDAARAAASARAFAAVTDLSGWREGDEEGSEGGDEGGEDARA